MRSDLNPQRVPRLYPRRKHFRFSSRTQYPVNMDDRPTNTLSAARALAEVARRYPLDLAAALEAIAREVELEQERERHRRAFAAAERASEAIRETRKGNQ